MDTHRHSTGVSVSDFDMTVDHHRVANESHRSHSDIITDCLQLELKICNFWIGIPVTYPAKASGLLAEDQTNIL